MAYQARCKKCRIHFRWRHPKPLTGARCPECGCKLTATTYMCRDRASKELPVYKEVKK